MCFKVLHSDCKVVWIKLNSLFWDPNQESYYLQNINIPGHYLTAEAILAVELRQTVFDSVRPYGILYVTANNILKCSTAIKCMLILNSSYINNVSICKVTFELINKY